MITIVVVLSVLFFFAFFLLSVLADRIMRREKNLRRGVKGKFTAIGFVSEEHGRIKTNYVRGGEK